MPSRTVRSSCARETEALGAELARQLTPGDVVLVQGELGAGKTTLVRGAARELGVSQPVTSPTFTIGNRYVAAGLTVSHLDLYRVASLEGEDPDLLDDYLGEGRIAFVEWPEDGAPEFAGARMRVTITHRGVDERDVEVDDRGVEVDDRGVEVDGREVEVDGRGVEVDGRGVEVDRRELEIDDRGERSA
ncbi:MAG TPA: tRNA (adenosine(37)-N6)-threonylcarbamoyltransferase complex ATPase subunit type 1 TsaE [Solirubrobacteraceae bacterium]|nr:tRNA (adenosine(37)-N6)-threonylcarbamoyltransferase complex ATPase subunit type 1 TsaE [Solirubrobacteraceae bacterium]